MGRDLYIYVIPRLETILHDSTKELCFGWEHEITADDFLNQKGAEMTGVNFDALTHKEVCSLCEKVTREFYKLKNDMKESGDRWCPRCRMFLQGIYWTPELHLAPRFEILHSYSNEPVNPWSFKDLYIGDDCTDLVSRFDERHLYREVVMEDVARGRAYLADNGHRHRTDDDEEALAESIEALDFCEASLKRGDCHVVYEHEFRI